MLPVLDAMLTTEPERSASSHGTWRVDEVVSVEVVSGRAGRLSVIVADIFEVRGCCLIGKWMVE